VQLRLSSTVWRLTTFLAVCLLGAFALIAIFAQLRFAPEREYHALFTSVSGLKDGNFVRIAGVEVGKVKSIAVQDNATVMVSFSADDSVVLTGGTRAVIRYDDLIGGRYMALQDGAGDTKTLPPDGTIPVTQTAPALSLDALIGGFRPLFRALNPDQVNALTGQLISAFQGEGPNIGSILAETAALTNTLADRDQLIGQVIVNLDTVLGSLGEHSDQFGKAVDSLSGLIHGLQQRKTDISNAVAYADASAGSIADLLTQARPPLQTVVNQTDRTAATVLADRDYFDNLLKTLPDAYRVLNRQAINGDFFGFYLCDLLLKVNGKGGQPVYVKVAGQDSGRCTPK
jgi:phospholipid/cholesterol/gamma-HCH transport system substrate-binding protein